MDNPDQKREFSASEQIAKKNSIDREREYSSRKSRDERHYGDDRSAAQERRRIRRKEKKERKRRARLNAQHYTSNPQNFHHQTPPRYFQPPPPSERFGRNQFSRQIDNRPNTTRYDRTRNDGYHKTRRQNYTQSSRSSGSHYFRRSNYDRRRSTSPQRRHNYYNNYNNRSNTKIRDSLRQYNDSSPPNHHRTLSESPKPANTIKESIEYQQVSTQFASLSYLDAADKSSVCLEDPPPKLLVLDLNGTLVYRDNGKRDIILRPHMNKFMQYIFESNSFAVMVWSSAQPINVDRMVRAAFGRYEKKLIAKWTRKHFNLSERDYNQKVETTKDLEKVWRELNNNSDSTTLPRIVWDQTNTVLIDDSCVKAKLQPYNAIHLPDFDNERCKSKNDHELHNVIDYLRKLHKQSNVSAYIKKYPYTPNTPNDSQISFTPKSRDYSKNNNNLEQERNNQCSPS